MINSKSSRLFLLCCMFGLLLSIQAQLNEQSIRNLRRVFRRQACPDSNMCRSKYDFCGTTDEYCGEGCKAGPCKGSGGNSQGNPCPSPNECRSKYGYCGTTAEHCGEGCTAGPCSGNGGNGGDIVNENNFGCVFNGLDGATRNDWLNSLRNSGYKPGNADEAAVFLAHVFHETGGLRTLEEDCAPTGCYPHYSDTWDCGIQPTPGKLYYGRGWFQLTYPCNYNAAGKALGLDLLNNPDLVSQQKNVAVSTAVWYFQTHNCVEPARRGDFAQTTREINGKVECNGGQGAAHQQTRVATYRRVRQCFGLGEPTINPTC